MKKVIYLFIMAALIYSCGTETKLIGDINMISERNIDNSTDYEELKRYAGVSKKELKKAKAENIQQAVDATVKSVPGGEYIKNAKIYLVNGEYYAIQGDVWGVNASHLGFKKGDRIQKGKKQGIIQNLIDNNECMVKFDGHKKPERVSYEKITKI